MREKGWVGGSGLEWYLCNLVFWELDLAVALHTVSRVQSKSVGYVRWHLESIHGYSILIHIGYTLRSSP